MPDDEQRDRGKLARFVLALSPWPLLIAAIAAFFGGARLLTQESREMAGAMLLTVGAVCVGAWIALLASHGYGGRGE